MLPAAAQEQTLDPFNCAAQGMQVGGGYECAPLGVGVHTPPPSEYAYINHGKPMYWWPDSGWWYVGEDGYLYPEG